MSAEPEVTNGADTNVILEEAPEDTPNETTPEEPMKKTVKRRGKSKWSLLTALVGPGLSFSRLSRTEIIMRSHCLRCQTLRRTSARCDVAQNVNNCGAGRHRSFGTNGTSQEDTPGGPHKLIHARRPLWMSFSCQA